MMNNIFENLFDGDFLNNMVKDIAKIQEDAMAKLKEQQHTISTSSNGYNIKVKINSMKEIVDVKVIQKEIVDVDAFMKALNTAIANAYEEVEYNIKKDNKSQIDIDNLSKDINCDLDNMTKEINNLFKNIK